jgi:hypothetical protein
MGDLPVIVTDCDDGYAEVAAAISRGSVVLLSLPCPGAWMTRGGIGGQALTACSFCGEVMASTAGPHSRDGRYFKPVIVIDCAGGYVAWRPFLIGDAPAEREGRCPTCGSDLRSVLAKGCTWSGWRDPWHVEDRTDG